MKSSAAVAAVAGSLVAVVSISLLLLRRRKSSNSRSIAGEFAEDECIYLDYNGTTSVYSFVLDAMLPYFKTHFGNPGSGHVYGDSPKAAVETARKQILTELLGCKKETPLSSIVLLSCGTESDNLAIHLALSNHDECHVVTTNVEHPAVEKCLKYYESTGRCTVSYVPVQPDGRVIAKEVIKAITSKTVLVTVMLANNESGAVQPVKEISEYCKSRKIVFFTDAAQAAGKISVRLKDLGYPDMMTIVGHKLGAPKGVACLYIRPDCLQASVALLQGGGQEFGVRGGTENVPYIVGFGTACAYAARNLSRNQQHMETLRHRLLTRLDDGVGVVVHGPSDPSQRLPNTLSVGFENVSSGNLLQALRTKVAASAGATCHATGPISSVLIAMQIPEDLARGTIRLSLGPNNTIDEIDRAAELLIDEVKRQRRQTPHYESTVYHR